MARRIDQLQAEIVAHRARLQSTGTLSDIANPQNQMLQLLDELAFIVKGQFGEIEKLRRRVRELERK